MSTRSIPRIDDDPHSLPVDLHSLPDEMRVGGDDVEVGHLSSRTFLEIASLDQFSQLLDFRAMEGGFSATQLESIVLGGAMAPGYHRQTVDRQRAGCNIS